jgi:IMP cyclohydrolase
MLAKLYLTRDTFSISLRDWGITMPTLELDPQRETVAGHEAHLKDSHYPGRLAIMGLAAGGDRIIQAYALMGRNEGSRQRIFHDTCGQEGLGVKTIAPNLTQEEMQATPNAKFIYYQAILERNGVSVVSNGAQTTPILDAIIRGHSLEAAVYHAPTVDGIDLSSYERDGINLTARISGVVDMRQHAPTPFGLSVVRKSDDSELPIRTTWSIDSLGELQPGIGYGVQTYAGSSQPTPSGVRVPSYNDPPFFYALGEGTEDTAERLWEEYLNPATKVALVVHSMGLVSPGQIISEDAARQTLTLTIIH